MNNPFLKKKGRHEPPASKDMSRRCFVRTAAAATAGTLAQLGTHSAGPRPVFQTTLSPEAALNELIEGNQRYVTGNMTAHEHDLQMLHAKTAEKQQPFAAVLSCADSRVPVELVFDQTIGHLFVCRLAGNVTTPEVIASLEYAAAVLGVRAIMVLGHSNCGAVAATIKGSAVPGQISALYPRIRPAVDLAGSNTEAATKANAKIQTALLAEASTVIGGLVKDNKIKVVAGYYDVTNGTVTLVG
jgi:carbonic anhydrase